MSTSYMALLTLGLSILLNAMPSHAAWRYDASCGSHQQALVTDGMPSAVSMIQNAVTGFGSAAPSGSRDIWSFPNTEARDLAGRIFGAIASPPYEYTLIQNGLAYMNQHYTTGGGATTGNEGAGDVVFYCDLKRLQKQTAADGKVTYVNQNNAREVWKEGDYNTCNYNSVTAATAAGGATMANTDLGMADYAVVQICPWYLRQTEASQYNTLKKVVRFWWYKFLNGFANTIGKYFYSKNVRQIDLIALFDVTLVHELTHAIQPNGLGITDSNRISSTTDIGTGMASYGWYNIYNLRTRGGYHNGDSWAYFALGIQQMQEGNRVNSDGTIAAIAPVNLAINNNVLVGSTWAPTRRLRPRDHVHRESLRSSAREIRKSSSSSASLSLECGNFTLSAHSRTTISETTHSGTTYSGTTYSGTAPATISACRYVNATSKTSTKKATSPLGETHSTKEISSTKKPTHTSNSVSKNSTLSTHSKSTPATISSSRYTTKTSASVSRGKNSTLPTSSRNTTATISSKTRSTTKSAKTTSSSSKLNTNLTASHSGTASKSKSSASRSITFSRNSTIPASTRSANSTGPVTSHKSGGSSSSKSKVSTSVPKNSTTSSHSGTGLHYTSTNIVSTSKGHITTIKTSVPIPTSSSGSRNSQQTNSGTSYIFSPTTTEPVKTTLIVPIVNPTYKPTISTEDVQSIVTATSLYIPSITNLAAFPTINIKNPDPNDKDTPSIPFVKLTLPSDKCKPLPKPSGGGLLGVAFHMASDVVNGVLDAACHLVAPVISGINPPPIDGKLPTWLSLDIYPPQDSFPDSENDPTSSPTKSASSTKKASSSSSSKKSSSSSSSSCSASAVHHCTASCAITTVSGKATSSCATKCATMTGCSATATTTTVSSSNSASALSIIDHLAPANTAWFGAQQALLGSLIAEAPKTIPSSYFTTATNTGNSTSKGTASKTASKTGSERKTGTSNSLKPSKSSISSKISPTTRSSSTKGKPSSSPSSKISPTGSTLSIKPTSAKVSPPGSSTIITKKPTPSATPTLSTIPISVSPSLSLCFGNQVEDNCQGGTLPSATPYSGLASPQCNVADGDKGSLPRINATQASSAVNTYCSNLVSQGVVLSSTSTSAKPGIISGAVENSGQLALSVLYDVNYCPTDKSVSTVDFAKLGYNECYSNLYTAISEVCAQDSTWGDYNAQYTLEGGVFGNDCAIWAMTSQV